MLIKWSPLVASASGKAADCVAATWKGRQYIRMYVIPHNPKSDAQKRVRESMTRCVSLWRSLHLVIKFWLDTYGVGYRMSGFNVFVQKNRLLEEDRGPLKPVPDNPHHDAVLDFAAVTGIGESGDIDLTWIPGDPTALTQVDYFTRETLKNKFTPLLAANDALGVGVITGLTPGTAHDVYACYFNPVSNECGTVVCIEDVSSKA